MPHAPLEAECKYLHYGQDADADPDSTCTTNITDQSLERVRIDFNESKDPTGQDIRVDKIHLRC